jgi:hypothetical protein
MTYPSPRLLLVNLHNAAADKGSESDPCDRRESLVDQTSVTDHDPCKLERMRGGEGWELPKRLIGTLRALSFFHMSAMLPPTRLIATLEAPPPKNLVTTRVAKFGANAEGNSQITNRM